MKYFLSSFSWPNTFVEGDHEIFSIVILLLPVIQEGILSVTSENVCSLSLSRKSVVRITDHLDMAMTWPLNPKQKYSKIAPDVSYI